jgi:hypothetical protein
MTKEELYLWKEKSDLWEKTSSNYKTQLDLADLTLKSQIELQDKREEIVKEELKITQKKGFRRGAATGAVITLILCLLVK